VVSSPTCRESAEQLDVLLLTISKARKVRQDGIHFEKMRYLDLTLAAYVGEWVTIRAPLCPVGGARADS
jgi:putative transposase